MEDTVIKFSLSKTILFIGQDFNDNGGISTVLSTYKEIFECFNFIRSTTTLGSNKLKNFFVLLKAIGLYIRYCFSSVIKIIHIHTASNIDFFRNSMFVIIGKIFKKKIILHIHGGMFRQFYLKYPKYITKIIKKCDYIITPSNYLANIVKMLHNDVIVLPNMIDQPLFEKKKANDNNKLHIIFLGTLNDNKGIFDILSVFGEEIDYLKDKVELYIGGRGDVYRLENMINQLELSNFVVYHGWLNKIEKHKLLSQADILIQPSLAEAFGISILEGMSYGLPIIATNVGGIPELVQNNINGFLIEPGSKQQIFDVVKYFVENPQVLKKMGEVSAEKAEPFFSKNVIQKLIAFYNTVFDTLT
jgi:glycosyltransferase involved in cell wall biosynthesis